MRDLKFRVWDKVLNKMITQENVKELLDKINSEEWETGYPYSSDEWYPAYQILGIFDYFSDIQKQGIKRYEPSENRFEIMQYTGLKDKNGKEIYEGDILLAPEYFGSLKCVCIYQQENIVSSIQGFGLYSYDSYFQKYRTLVESDEWDDFEVIGNIYENPELLEIQN